VSRISDHNKDYLSLFDFNKVHTYPFKIKLPKFNFEVWFHIKVCLIPSCSLREALLFTCGWTKGSFQLLTHTGKYSVIKACYLHF